MQAYLSWIVALFLLLPSGAGAEERNGLFVSVSKRTLNRADRRPTAYYTQYDRTQGYKVTVKNTALKPFPEGELNWTILVMKSYGTAEKYTGVEKVKPLRSAESVELLIGAVPIAGYRYDRDYKDEMEHEIVITHGGKETIRSSSKPSFAALARRATLIEAQTPENDPAQTAGAAATPAAPRAGVAPGTTPPRVPVPPVAAAPAVPAAPSPANPAPSVPAPAPSPAEPPITGTANPPPTDPANPAQPFDFFNLNKKPKTPAAK
jgi:hypothetical protein